MALPPKVFKSIYISFKLPCLFSLPFFFTAPTAHSHEFLGQIHGDLNENNILLSHCNHTDTDSSPNICGLLDFYDTSKSYLVYDLAICTAHAMVMAMGQTRGQDTPDVTKEIPGHLLAGYLSVLELRPAERRALRTCIAARMVASLVSGQHEYLRQPDNEYLMENAGPGWEVLETLWTAEAASVEKSWDGVVHSYRTRQDF